MTAGKTKTVGRAKKRKRRESLKGEMDVRASERGQTVCVGGDGEGELDELTPSLRVSQGASMQRMLPDSPWYWLVLRPGIHLAHAHFTLSAV